MAGLWYRTCRGYRAGVPSQEADNLSASISRFHPRNKTDVTSSPLFEAAMIMEIGRFKTACLRSFRESDDRVLYYLRPVVYDYVRTRRAATQLDCILHDWYVLHNPIWLHPTIRRQDDFGLREGNSQLQDDSRTKLRWSKVWNSTFQTLIQQIMNYRQGEIT